MRELDMTIGGWIFLVLSWGTILVVAGYCYKRVLFKK